jgi:hypothetical protein
MIKRKDMNTPAPLHHPLTAPDAQHLSQQYELMSGNNEPPIAEPKKNLLLTPFLLSIPVIMILFILISGTSSDIPDTINAEPVQRDVVSTERIHRIHVADLTKDSVLSNSKLIALPAKK